MIRFYNGRLLSFKNGFEITDDEVWTNGSEIAFVGKITIKGRSRNRFKRKSAYARIQKCAHTFGNDLCAQPCG